jgi:RNA polymerase sigma-70 factor (ECF subfamily)
VDDAALLAAVAKGDAVAFRELVTRHHRAVVRVARYYVPTDATAEDVAQETWIAVMKGAARFEGRSSVTTWLFRIASNTARKAGVRERRSVPIDPTDPVPAARFDEGGAWNSAPQPFTDVIDARLDRSELVRAAREELDSLGEPQRTVVTLRDVEGLSVTEVADVLGLSEANVRVIAYRGRARIRERLENMVRGGAS